MSRFACRGPGGLFHCKTGKKAGFSESGQTCNVREGRAQGVCSYSTVLGLYAAPEPNPPNVSPKLEITVPKNFRRMGEAPPTRHPASPESGIEYRSCRTNRIGRTSSTLWLQRHCIMISCLRMRRYECSTRGSFRVKRSRCTLTDGHAPPTFSRGATLCAAMARERWSSTLESPGRFPREAPCGPARFRRTRWKTSVDPSCIHSA